MIIENLFNTIITCNKYNVNAQNLSSGIVTITVTCLDFNGIPVVGKEINLYYDNTLVATSRTNANGVITYSRNCYTEQDDFGLHTFHTDTGAVAQIEVYRDTGWQGVTFNSGFQNYSGYTTSYRVYNNIVEISGIFMNTKSVTPSTNGVNFASIPSRYAPAQSTYSLQQGSGASKFLLSVDTQGNLKIARYGTTSTDTALPWSNNLGGWLHSYMKYMLG